MSDAYDRRQDLRSFCEREYGGKLEPHEIEIMVAELEDRFPE